MYGTFVDGFDPRTARDAACIVVWGANPHASAPHAHEHWLREAPGKVIVVDPIRTPTAAEADIHLQPFPGSDAALAFALLSVIHRDGLIDESFVSRHVLGWEELRPAIAACDLGRLGEATGVPVRLIEEAAHLYAPGPSLLWLGQGLQRQITGGNVMRACAMLPALTGNLCKPGAGFLYLNGNLAQRGMDEAYLSGAHLAEARGKRAQADDSRRRESHGSRRHPRGSPALACAVRVEHEPVELLPQSDAFAERVATGRFIDRGGGPVSHRFHRAGRLCAAGGELPGVRRHRRAVFQFEPGGSE